MFKRKQTDPLLSGRRRTKELSNGQPLITMSYRVKLKGLEVVVAWHESNKTENGDAIEVSILKYSGQLTTTCNTKQVIV